MPRAGAAHERARASSRATAGRRVFLVDDHHLFRAGVRAELGDAVEVVGEADEVAAAIELIGERLPDVVLLDVHMPDGGGQAVIEAVRRAHPEVSFLALSVSDARRGRDRGHPGRRPRLRDQDDLGARARRRHRAGWPAVTPVFSPRLAGFVLDAFAGDAPDGGAAPRSTPSSTSSPRASARCCA